ELFRRVRTIGNGRALTPTADGGLAYSQFSRKLCRWPPAALDISPRLRRGRGVGVEVQFHDARRSRTYEIPRSTPIPFNQSSGTKHEGGASSNHGLAITGSPAFAGDDG